MTRPTPYDLLMGGLDEARLDALDSESFDSPEELMHRQAAGEALHDLAGGSPGAAVLEYASILYHALRFRRADRMVFDIEESLLRALAATRAPLGHWPLRPPAPAGYIRFPELKLWALVQEDAPAEAVDGFFWAMSDRRLELLLCLGMWSGRPGLSVVPVSAVVPDDPGHWADMPARADGEDFSNVLPGGEIDALLALTTPLEALKLASRIFHHIAEHPHLVDAGGEHERRVRAADG